MPQVTAVCLTRSLQPRTATDPHRTGIDKSAVRSIMVDVSGVEHDSVMDTEDHGGRTKALYAYADEDAAWWAGELEEAVPPGRFGENLRTAGIDVGGAVIGERWRTGSGVVVEVTSPRVPCSTFAHHMGRPGWVKRFWDANRTGAYLAVTTPGTLRPGDTVEVVDVPTHGVSIQRWFGRNEPDDARALLAWAEGRELPLDPGLSWSVRQALRAR